jgi:hypothetical protein
MNWFRTLFIILRRIILILIPISFGRLALENKDIFGFADAIQLDHLNLEQLKELEKILDKIK